MKRYLLIFLLIPLVGAGKEKAKHTPSKSQIETVKDWLKTEGIQSPEEVSVCNNNTDARFPLGSVSIQWPQAVYTNMLCLRNVGFIRNRNITPDGPTYSVNPYGETVVGPVLQNEKGTETMRVVEIPVETVTRYKAVYNRKEDKGQRNHSGHRAGPIPHPLLHEHTRLALRLSGSNRAPQRRAGVVEWPGFFGKFRRIYHRVKV